MVYAFALTTPDPGNITGVDEGLLKDFVDTAKQNVRSINPIIVAGGWSGSQYFSTVVSTSDNRTKFISAILNLVTKYDLDGIDFDSEYPGHQEIGCNVVHSDDSANFLLLLQDLRKKNPVLEPTAAVVAPFTGPDGNPMTDVSDFAKVLDRIELMVYDIRSSKTNVGPNAPLSEDWAPSRFQFGSVKPIVAQWTEANFPAQQIVLGLAAYGHSYTVTPEAAINQSSRSLNMGGGPAGSSDTPDDLGTDPCGNPYGLSGVFTFKGLATEGFLEPNGNANHNYAIDPCSSTSFVYDQVTHVMVSYDDAKSFDSTVQGLKGNFITENKLAGFAMWDATGDHNDFLLDTLHSAMGIENCE
ncbi:Glycoside hydrolase family 18 protein [Mycena venus]|uniref:Glycoside hydrolase family 18 protein n=1 Tax=Mycena venus TaxID=2733690 RepID=A0A8H7D0C7_9AGAR|nr:Glycoside hydrolase family 18 protein [Mycena venus]